eukprot:Phypoly_transcript_14238.p1 GENE.Phypoly_transcript_14238~~Phypoly_transcript_14238.p1  ORF type:complete len:285 (+),score=17.74 Phypoly_transcript_14238:57-911(+)
MEEGQVFNKFLSCAHCFAPYLKLPDLRALVATSKLCYKIFTDTQLWLAICHQNNIRIEVTPITDPYTQLCICSPNLNVAAHWTFTQWESHDPFLFIDHSGRKNHLFRIPYQHPQKNPPPKHAIFAHTVHQQALKLEAEFTAEVILRPCGLGSGRECEFPVLSKFGPGGGWEIRCNNDCISFVITPHIWIRPQEIFYKREKPNGEDWMHVAATFDGIKMCLYVNGKLAANKQFGAQRSKIADSRHSFSIGFCQAMPERCLYVGEIKEARICYKTLAPEQFLCTKF